MYIFEEAEKKGYGVEKFQVVQLNLQTILIEIVHSVMYNKVKSENTHSGCILKIPHKTKDMTSNPKCTNLFFINSNTITETSVP